MFYFPLRQPLHPATLDIILAKGYYRMQQAVFTTQAIRLESDAPIEVLWARIKLEHFKPNKLHGTLIRRCKHLQCLPPRPAVITDEIEALYTAYKTGIHFDAPETVTSFLMGESITNYFPAMMWMVHDAGKLVAVSYFDAGATSAAGILSFYHPEYKKYSLGKWLYFESVRYAAEHGRAFFYPGYVALGFSKFDYKLEAALQLTELWDMEAAEWQPYTASKHEQQFPQ